MSLPHHNRIPKVLYCKYHCLIQIQMVTGKIYTLTRTFLEIFQFSVGQMNIRVQDGPVLPVPCQSRQNSEDRQVKN